MEIPGPWSRNSDSIGVSGALEPAFDKFLSGYDAYLPWEAPGQGTLARAGWVDQMASPGPHVMPYSLTFCWMARTGFFLVAINQGHCQWQIGVVGMWKGQHWYQNTWVSSSPLYRNLCSCSPALLLLTSSPSWTGVHLLIQAHWELSKKGKWTHREVLWGNWTNRVTTLVEIKKGPRLALLVHPLPPPHSGFCLKLATIILGVTSEGWKMQVLESIIGGEALGPIS